MAWCAHQYTDYTVLYPSSTTPVHRLHRTISIIHNTSTRTTPYYIHHPQHQYTDYTVLYPSSTTPVHGLHRTISIIHNTRLLQIVHVQLSSMKSKNITQRRAVQCCQVLKYELQLHLQYGTCSRLTVGDGAGAVTVYRHEGYFGFNHGMATIV